MSICFGMPKEKKAFVTKETLLRNAGEQISDIHAGCA
jgi:hypothetical protein